MRFTNSIWFALKGLSLRTPAIACFAIHPDQRTNEQAQALRLHFRTRNVLGVARATLDEYALELGQVGLREFERASRVEARGARIVVHERLGAPGGVEQLWPFALEKVELAHRTGSVSVDSSLTYRR